MSSLKTKRIKFLEKARDQELSKIRADFDVLSTRVRKKYEEDNRIILETFEVNFCVFLSYLL